jgi:hypothetical protein
MREVLEKPGYAPSLSIGPGTGGNVQISWPTGGRSPYRLQFSSDLRGTNWANLSSKLLKVNGDGFLRLMKQ